VTGATVPVARKPWTSGYQRFIQTPFFTAAFLGLILATPSAVSYIFVTSSQAAGTAVAVAVVALALAPSLRLQLRLVAMAMIVAGIGAHFVAARYITPVDNVRFASSLVLLVGMMLSAHFIAQWLVSVPDDTQRRAMTWLRIAMIMIAIMSMAQIEPPRWDLSIPAKAIFPFTEHSHFALVFTPLLLEGCIRSRGLVRMIWLGSGVLVALLLQNLTILTGVALVILVTAPLWQLALALAVVAGASATMDLSYYLSRLDLSTGTNNLSALVYIQGYDFIIDSFGLTSGWGLGFQQLGVIPMNSPASNVIYALTKGLSLNLNDGGFGAAKIASEFGAFGLALIGYFALVVAQMGWRLRQMALAERAPSSLKILPYCFIVGFTIEMFVRGVGYFSATVFMLIASILLLNFIKKMPVRTA
jgi:hypothetical protein